ncbi:MAG: hypothetical protein COA79_06535 [Planctomycetota bacterium]|nr:MAG: hypothetical protein COA79_06535 [Planctomycetota bacterium]
MKNKLKIFFKEKLWSDELFKDSFWLNFLVKRLRIVFLVFKGFLRHECFTRASALTYVSVLAFIPLLALIFYIASVHANENIHQLEMFLNDFFRPADGSKESLVEGAKEVNPFVHKLLYFVKNIDMKNFGLFGILFLLITSISLIKNIETALNKIWGLKNDRPWIKKIPTYSFVLLTLPFFVILSITLSASFNAFAIARTRGVENILENWTSYFYILDLLITWTKSILHIAGDAFSGLVPFVFSWFAFLMLYCYLPNTKVRFKYGAIGALIGSVLFELAKPLFTQYVSEFAATSNITKVYGVLSFLPITLLWIYIIWLIVLFGAEFTYAIQNVKLYQRELQLGWLNQRSKELIILKFVNLMLIKQKEGDSILLDDLYDQINVPESFVNSSLQIFIDCKILTHISDENEYKFEKPIEEITPYFILKTMRDNGNDYGEDLKDTYPYLDEFISQIESYNIDFPFQLNEKSSEKKEL